MNFGPEFESIFEVAKKRYSEFGDPAHDIDHLYRVAFWAHQIGNSIGVNFKVLTPAVLLHDCVAVPKDSEKRSESGKICAMEALKILSEVGYDTSFADQIGKVISEHNFSAGIKATSNESAALQDADRLDALGAVGVMRLASVGTQLKSKFYCSSDPFAIDRAENDREFMIDHINVKLAKLPETMNTVVGRNEAKKATPFYQVVSRSVEI